MHAAKTPMFQTFTHRWRGLLGGLAALGLLGATTGCTATDGVVTRACDLSRSSVSTGYDQLTDDVVGPGASDPKWVVVSDGVPATVEPRPATVINPEPAWVDAEPGSQWIGPYAEGTTDPGGWGCDDPHNPPTDPRDPAFNQRDPVISFRDTVTEYLYCFCQCDDDQTSQFVAVQGLLRADNEASIVFNGTQILAQTDDDTFKNGDPVPFSVPPNLVRPGINCLEVEVRNDCGTPTGLMISGQIATLSCCEGRVVRPSPEPWVADPLAAEPLGPEALKGGD